MSQNISLQQDFKLLHFYRRMMTIKYFMRAQLHEFGSDNPCIIEKPVDS